MQQVWELSRILDTGGETKISHAAGCGDKVKKKKKMKKKNNLTGKKLEDHKIHTIQNTFFCEK